MSQLIQFWYKWKKYTVANIEKLQSHLYISYIFLYKLPVVQDHKDFSTDIFMAPLQIYELLDYKYILKYICFLKKHLKSAQKYM